MQHVTAEGTALVKQAEDAASNKKVSTICPFLKFFGIEKFGSSLFGVCNLTCN